MRGKVTLRIILVFVLVLLIGISAGTFAAASASRPDKQGNTQNPNYPRNAYGETYGSLADCDIPGMEPDLVKALGVDGKTVGYVRYADMNGPEPRTLEEALAQNAEANVAKRIPLYTKDGRTIIGEFEIGPGSVECITAPPQ